MDQIITELRKTVCAGENTPQETCAALLALISGKSGPEQLEYFKTFFQEIEPPDLESSEFESPIDLFRVESLSKSNVNGLIALETRLVVNLTRQRVDIDVFYSTLRDKLFDETLIDSDAARISFLLILWFDARLPYYQLEEGCCMEEDEFGKLAEKIEPFLKKGRYILYANLPYKTQRSSLLMDLADQLENKEERVVFWGILMGELIQQIHPMNR